MVIHTKRGSAPCVVGEMRRGEARQRDYSSFCSQSVVVASSASSASSARLSLAIRSLARPVVTIFPSELNETVWARAIECLTSKCLAAESERREGGITVLYCVIIGEDMLGMLRGEVGELYMYGAYSVQSGTQTDARADTQTDTCVVE